MARTVRHFAQSGHSVLVSVSGVTARSFDQAIEAFEEDAENVVGAISVASANPSVPLGAYASSRYDQGVKFFVPPDRIIRHGTNVPGYLDALPEVYAQAKVNPKLALLLRLFRASLRERDTDHQILFQLILFEEASDGEEGEFAQRLRSFTERHGVAGDLDRISQDFGIELPDGKDVVDLLVRLRNAATHNGDISPASLREWRGEWVVPFLQDKERLHRVITDALRYVFCALVGHTRDKMAVGISGPDSFGIRFD